VTGDRGQSKFAGRRRIPLASELELNVFSLSGCAHEAARQSLPFDSVPVPVIGTNPESFQTLRSASAYWSSDRPDTIAALKVAPEVLSNDDLVQLIRELDRRFIQLWDKVTFERRHDLVDYSRLPKAHKSRECGDPE